MEAFADSLFEQYPIPAAPPAQASDLLGAFFGAAPDRTGSFAKGLDAGAQYRLRSAQGDKTLQEAYVEREKRIKEAQANTLRSKVAADPNYIPTPSEALLIATGANDFASSLGARQEQGFRTTLGDPNAAPAAQFAAGQAVQGKVLPQVQALGAGREIDLRTQNPYTNPVGGAAITQDLAAAGASDALTDLRGRTDPNIRSSGPGAGGAPGLPVAAYKIVDEAMQAIGTAEQSESLAAEAKRILETAGVDLSLTNNLMNRGANYLGVSTPESTNYATVQQTFEKLRNNYLLLAKGVQTEGDAKRAWESEIGEAAQFDNALAAQQLERALTLIDMSRNMQRRRIDGVYQNYGVMPPAMQDVYGGGQPPAAPAAPAATGGGLTPAEQAELAQLRAELGGG